MSLVHEQRRDGRCFVLADPRRHERRSTVLPEMGALSDEKSLGVQLRVSETVYLIEGAIPSLEQVQLEARLDKACPLRPKGRNSFVDNRTASIRGLCLQLSRGPFHLTVDKVQMLEVRFDRCRQSLLSTSSWGDLSMGISTLKVQAETKKAIPTRKWVFQ